MQAKQLPLEVVIEAEAQEAQVLPMLMAMGLGMELCIHRCRSHMLRVL